MKKLFVFLMLCGLAIGCHRGSSTLTPAAIVPLAERQVSAPVRSRAWRVAFTEPEGWTQVFTGKEYVAEFRNDMLDASIGLRAMEFVVPIVPDEIAKDFRMELERDMAVEVDGRFRDFRSFPEKENGMSGVMAWYVFGDQVPWRERRVTVLLPKRHDHIVLIAEGD